MITANPSSPESRRFAITLPRPSWIAIATLVWIIVGVGLRTGLPVYRQHMAIREIERVGGIVETERMSQDWLRDWLGYDGMRRLEKVNRVRIFATPVPDGTLDHVGWLTGLRTLVLDNTQVSAAGLAHLKGLANLQMLSLANTRVTDGGLARLAELTRVQSILLDNSNVTDADLAHLKGLTRLQSLSLDNTDVGDVGLMHIKRLPNLERLSLGGTRVTDAGLA
ncbi:MAG: leucine-rich repeat domain-containing protein, partial [Deltaproteobacteria bacterium]